MTRLVALALVLAGLAAAPVAPATASATVVGDIYQWGTTTCSPATPVTSCTHSYSTAPPPLYGPACEERPLGGSYAPTCSATFDATSVQASATLPSAGTFCYGAGDATISISSAYAGGPFTLPVRFVIDHGIARIEGEADFGTTHVEVGGWLSGNGICATAPPGSISDVSLFFVITY